MIIKDNNENKYFIEDINKFKHHLYCFHTFNGKANFSVHEENGYYFTVTTKLLDEVNKFIKNNK